MNCISALRSTARHWLMLVSALALASCGVSESESADRTSPREYSVHYTLRADPEASRMHVTMELRQPRDLVRALSFALDENLSDIDGDGDVQMQNGQLIWTPPSKGGRLEWKVAVHSKRGAGAYDALLHDEWGIFRAEDVIPRARTRTLKGAESRTTMTFDLPTGWTAVSEYSAIRLPIVVDRPDRRFDEPVGWIAMGRLGVRRETIAGIRVVVVGPEGHDVRRLDMLALLGWSLPELAAILPREMSRLTIVSAADPMWRGGLSAPASMFIHADRPMISENATSSLLHEVMHVAMPIDAVDGYDWIAEGLAEYYSIELLHRGNAITEKRTATAFERQADWAKQAETLCGRASTGATTALAVTLFKQVDSDLLRQSDGSDNLDTLLPLLTGTNVDVTTLASAIETLGHSVPDVLHIDNLPGCRSIASGMPRS